MEKITHQPTVSRHLSISPEILKYKGGLIFLTPLMSLPSLQLFYLPNCIEFQFLIKMSVMTSKHKTLLYFYKYF